MTSQSNTRNALGIELSDLHIHLGGAVAHVVGRRGFSKLAAGEHYERVLTAVMLVAVLVGLIGALS